MKAEPAWGGGPQHLGLVLTIGVHGAGGEGRPAPSASAMG
jgi:hypothetical protein